MKKIKVLLSWVLTICMMATLFTGFNTASAATTLDALGIVLDDNTVTASTAVGNTFTVKIPDGRPRVPQVSCTGATVYQAQLPDTATEADATVIKDGTTYTIKFVKDASLGFVLQYDDYYTWNSGLSGASYTSSNTGIATVSSNGEIHVVKVSDTPVTITATLGSDTKTLTITKTIRAVLGIWLVTGQSNSAYNYNDPAQSVAPKKGTGIYFGPISSLTVPASFTNMTQDNGKAAVGGVEPGIAKALYEKTGEKNLVMNAGISGTGIAQFLPGVSTSFTSSSGTWALINAVYEKAYELWNKSDFQSKYETRLRSYFFLQGCAEVSSHWSKHYDGFAVNKNTNSFTTLGTNYPAGTHTFRTYMTDILGFDYCMDMMVAWRPVGITASTRTAQFKLAEDFDDYFVASRIGQTFSQAEGSYRYDELHFNQVGKNYYGLHTGANAARIYSGKQVLEPATSAKAYFNQIGFADGQTLYVKAGDFYNYCTRPSSWTSDDTFGYKFVGDSIVNFDGENDFAIKKDATPGSSCKMEIYSCSDNTTPIATINIQVVGNAAENFDSINTEEYTWTFENNQPTTTAGDIVLTPASESNSGFAGKTALEMSRDLTLDGDGYWSIEWKSNGVGNGSMLLSSADEFSKTTDANNQPHFIFVYHTNDTGWRLFRDSGWTDNFWRGYTGNAITGNHVFKLECRDNVYTFSIDGEVMDSRKIVEGHGAYGSESSYSGAGKFSNEFNVHYLLGGINQNGLASTKYGYSGDVEYVTIRLGDEDPTISKINNYPYGAKSGKGTAEDPYVIDVNVAAGTKIDATAFTASTPAGTLALSAEKFGGESLGVLSCDAGTKNVYAMILGALPHMSTFYKINFIVSANPDKLPDDIYPDTNTVMVDAAAADLDIGDAKQYTVEGKTYSFVAGHNLYAKLSEAYKAVKDGATILMAAGTYNESVTFAKNVTVKGAQAGVNPNAKTADEKVWDAVRSDLSKETVITGLWTVSDGCDTFTVDGVAFNKTGRLYNGKKVDNSEVAIELKNILVDGLTNDAAFRFGDTSANSTVAIFGSVTIENMRAVNLTKNHLIYSGLNNVTIQNSYFHGGSRVGKFTLPDVVDDTTEIPASFTFTGNLLDGATKAYTVDFALASDESKSAAAYGEIDVTVSENVFLNTVSAAVTETVGVVELSVDQDTFTFAFEDNLIYEGDASVSAANKAFVVVGSGVSLALEDTDRGDNYTFKRNRFISTKADVPMIVSSDIETRKNNNNINVGGNYAEVAGVCVTPNTNTASGSLTQDRPVSFLNYYYTKADLSESTCEHDNTTTTGVPASCQGAGYEDLVCAACGEVLQHTDLPKTDHINSDWIVEVEATCTTAGVEVQNCTFCGEKQAERPVEKLGHDDGKWKTVTDASCAQEGKRARLCTRCDYELESIVLAKKDHSFESVNVVEATCTAAGAEDFECIVCGATKTEVLPQLLHTPGKWTVTTEPDCAAGTDGERQILCTECDKVMDSEVIAYEHSYVDEVILPSERGSLGVTMSVCEICGEPNAQEPISLIIPEQAALTIFEDVSKNDWFIKNESVDTMLLLGLFTGTGKTTFSPQMKMTRAMFVTVLSRLDGAATDNDVTTRFEDVAVGAWYTGAVAWAAENAIVSGTSYYTFEPNAPITREQICKMMVNYIKFADLKLYAVAEEKTFADQADISSWAATDVKICQVAGIITGKERNRFDPQGYATRAEVATIFTQLLRNPGFWN